MNDEDPFDRGLRQAFDGQQTPSPDGPRGQGGSARPVPDPQPAPASASRSPRASLAIDLSGDSRYELVAEAGRGGLGIVFRGWDRDLNREVALKVLDQRLAHDAGFVRRFIEEAQVCGRLQHPGIVPVHEIGLDRSERPFFVMKLIAGRTLGELLAERRSPHDDRHRFLDVFLRICQTLAYAHQQRVIHRDLKPANVMIGSFGEVQIVDWGLAKVLAGPDAAATHASPLFHPARSSRNTVAGTLLGTPAYMAPEQARGEIGRLDQRTDVFALGAILCEILTGLPPYPSSEGDILAAARTGDLSPALARLARCEADRELIDLARKCLQPDPADRPESAEVVARAVEEYLAALDERTHRAEVRAAEARVRFRWTVVLAATILLACTLGGAAWLNRRNDQEARRIDAERTTRTALQEAAVLRSQAESGGEDLIAWQRAVAMAENARAVATARGASDEAVREAETALAAVRTRAEQKQRNAAMKLRLLHVRVPVDDLVQDGANLASFEAQVRAGYAAAFRDFGVDVEAMSAATAAAALSGEIAKELAAALDSWRLSLDEAPESRERAAHLDAILDGLDSDPWRCALRQAYRSKAAAGDLLQLATTVDPMTQPAASLAVLVRSLWAAGLEEAAIAHCQRFRAFHPQSFGLELWLGFAFENMSPPRYAESATYYRLAQALRPELREVLHRLGQVLAKAGDRQGSRAIFERLCASEPQRGHWLGHLALLLCEDPDQRAQALAHAERALALEPAAEQHAFLGMVHAFSGSWDPAIASLSTAVALRPRVHVWHHALAKALRANGDMAAAIRALRTVVDLQPDHAQAQFELGSFLNLLGRSAEALEVLRQLCTRRPDHALGHLNMGIILCETGDTKAGLTALSRAIEADPRSATVRQRVGECQRRLGLHDEALLNQEVALILDPSLAEARVERAALLKEREARRTVDDLKEVVAADARDVAAKRKLATALRDLGQLPEAIRWQREVVHQQPDDVTDRRLLAEMLMETASYADAAEAYEALVAKEPADAALHRDLGRAYGMAGRLDRALAAIDRAIELEPRHPGGHVLRATAQKWRGQIDEAAASLNRAIELAPDDPSLHSELLWLLLDAWRVDAAAAQLARIRGRFAGRMDVTLETSVSKAQAMIANQARWRAVAAGSAAARDAADWAGAAGFALSLGNARQAAELWRRGLAACPDLHGHRPARLHDAAYATVLGALDPGLSATERSEWRLRAMAWLETDLVFWEAELRSDAERESHARQALRYWFLDVFRDGWASVRDERELAQLPREEAARWRRLWAKAEALLHGGR